MSYIFIVITLVFVGILFYVFRKHFRTSSIEIGIDSIETNKKQDKPSAQNSALADSAVKQIPSIDIELMELKRHLNAIVLGNQRVYKSNLEIARLDFARRGMNNPSEGALLKRAIEIWKEDNR